MESYDEAKEWMVAKAAQYGGMYAFQCSDEYRLAYPVLKGLHESYKKAMGEAGVREGDEVERHIPGIFIMADEVWRGRVVLHGGIPKVKIKRGSKTTECVWNKAWKKVIK